jgi:hypothetical protein
MSRPQLGQLGEFPSALSDSTRAIAISHADTTADPNE